MKTTNYTLYNNIYSSFSEPQIQGKMLTKKILAFYVSIMQIDRHRLIAHIQ